jgi:hypothetical protein
MDKALAGSTWEAASAAPGTATVWKSTADIPNTRAHGKTDEDVSLRRQGTCALLLLEGCVSDSSTRVHKLVEMPASLGCAE